MLSVLTREPAHGYEIRRRVERVAAGSVSLNPNVLYPALRRFEEMGALEMTVESQQGRPPRHVYRLTRRGRHALADMLRDFSSTDARNTAEFNVRVAFFEELGVEDRLAILDARQAALEAQRDQLRAFAENSELTEWNALVVAHAADQNKLQRNWVSALRRRVVAQDVAAKSKLDRPSRTSAGSRRIARAPRS